MTGEGTLPNHVAIIMDGNGRWAKARRLPRVEGHREGKKAAQAIIDAAIKYQVKALTLFAFSTENWKRPQTEVSFLFNLLNSVLESEVEKLSEKQIVLRFIGTRERLSERLRQSMEKAENLTRDNTGLCLNIAIDYGGRWDVVEAARRCAAQVQAQQLNPNDITEAVMGQQMSLSGLPEVDLMIRTGDVCRISNFLLWEAAYAELYFSEKMWPDFTEDAFRQALENFSARERRYGKISEQLETA